ncbi:hypothetical protein AB834_05480 [PVC group bacterium (ex Bugula neritina AB1)]|nr:hypothetical protein AB834_05480 [PVC group bacterium (ex Bugula neritina AB1)]
MRKYFRSPVAFSVISHIVLFLSWPKKNIEMFEVQRGLPTVEVHLVEAPLKSKESMLPEKNELMLKMETSASVQEESEVDFEQELLEELSATAEEDFLLELEEELNKTKDLDLFKEEKIKKKKKPEKKETKKTLDKNTVLTTDADSQKTSLVKDNKTALMQKNENHQAEKEKEDPELKPHGADYPVAKGRAGEERGAFIDVSVDPYGQILDFNLVDVKGAEDLDASQLRHLRNWIFNPKTVEHLPRHSWIPAVMDQLKSLGVEKVHFEMKQIGKSLVKTNEISKDIRIYTVSELDKAPIPLESQNYPPRYPRDSQKKGHEGVTILKMHINPRGEVVSLEIIQSSGHEELDDEAFRAVEIWSFRPGKLKGIPVDCWLEQEVPFEL